MSSSEPSAANRRNWSPFSLHPTHQDFPGDTRRRRYRHRRHPPCPMINLYIRTNGAPPPSSRQPTRFGDSRTRSLRRARYETPPPCWVFKSSPPGGKRENQRERRERSMVVEVDILFYVRVEPDGSKGCSTRTTECKKFFLVILKYRRCSIVMVMRGRG